MIRKSKSQGRALQIGIHISTVNQTMYGTKSHACQWKSNGYEKEGSAQHSHSSEWMCEKFSHGRAPAVPKNVQNVTVAQRLQMTISQALVCRFRKKRSREPSRASSLDLGQLRV